MQSTLSERRAAWIYSRARPYCRGISWLTLIFGVIASVSFANAVVSAAIAFLAFPELFTSLVIANAVLVVMSGLMAFSAWERCGLIRLLDTKDEEIRSLKKMRDELLHKLESESHLIEPYGGARTTRFRA
jgi:hypothetical protein